MKKILPQGLKRLGNPLIGIVLGFGALQLGNGILEDGEFERTRREVQLEIDVDKNKVFTNDEWGPVYEFHGLENSELYGLDLTIEQLNGYLFNQQGGNQ